MKNEIKVQELGDFYKYLSFGNELEIKSEFKV
jgi:hypothetical protein